MAEHSAPAYVWINGQVYRAVLEIWAHGWVAWLPTMGYTAMCGNGETPQIAIADLGRCAAHVVRMWLADGKEVPMPTEFDQHPGIGLLEHAKPEHNSQASFGLRLNLESE